MLKTQNKNQLFIALADATSGTLEGDTIYDYADLTDGEVALMDAKNYVLNVSGSLVAADFPTQKFKLMARSGTQIFESPLIGKENIVSYTLGVQAAEVQQIDYVGYNGTSGSLGAIVSNIHTIRLYIQESTIQGFMQQKIKEGFYKSASTTTQRAIGLGLCKSLIANYSREPEQDIRFERINAGAQADGLATSTVSVVKGSDKIVCSEDMTALIVAGTVLRFGTSGAGVAPCYVVTGHDGGTTTARIYTLDMPYQGATDATYAAATFESVTEGNWGIKMTGVDRGFVPGLRNPEPVRWTADIDFGDGSATVVTKSTAAVDGVGTAQKIAKLELELQADENVYRGFAEGGVVDRKQITDVALAAGTLYDQIVLELSFKEVSGLGVVVNSPMTIIIASAGGTNAVMEDANSGIVVGLDKLIVTNWAIPGAATLQSSMT